MFQHLSKKTLILTLIVFWGISIALVVYYTPSLKSTISTQNPVAYVVNVQKIWEDLPATKHLKSDLQKVLSNYHHQLSKIELELKAEHQGLLSSQKSTMSAQELQILEKRKTVFEAKVAATQKDVEAKQQSIGQRHHKATEKLHSIIQEKVKEVAQAQEVELILSTHNVIYADPNRDLTAQVYEKVKAATLNFHME